MEDNLDIALRRDEINHDLVRGIILRDIFEELDNPEIVPGFNLESFEQNEAKLNFRFLKEDIARLVLALRIPEPITTRSGHTASSKKLTKYIFMSLLNISH